MHSRSTSFKTPHLFGRIFMRLRNEITFAMARSKFKCYFPKRVVGIDEQRLGAILN